MTSTVRTTRQDAPIVGLVSSAHFVSHFYQLALPALFPLLRDALDAPYLGLGLVMTIFYASSGLAQAGAGFLVDRLGARPVLVTGLALLSTSMALAGLVPSYPGLLPIALLAGFGNSVFHPADYSILSALVEPSRVGRAFSVHGVAGTIGYAAAPAVVVGLSAWLGWRGALVAAGAAGLAVTLALAMGARRLIPSFTREPRGGAERAGRVTADLRILITAPIVLAFVYFALHAGANIGVKAFSVPAMIAIYGVPLGFATAALTGYLVGTATGILAGGFIADRVRRHDLAAASGLVVAALLLCSMGSGSLSVEALVPILVLAGFSLGATVPPRDMLVRAAAPAGASGKVFGLVYSGLDLGEAVVPLFLGWLLDRGEPRLLFVFVGALMLLTTATVVQIRRRTVLAARA
jgi:MFS family permease